MGYPMVNSSPGGLLHIENTHLQETAGSGCSEMWHKLHLNSLVHYTAKLMTDVAVQLIKNIEYPPSFFKSTYYFFLYIGLVPRNGVYMFICSYVAVVFVMFAFFVQYLGFFYCVQRF